MLVVTGSFSDVGSKKVRPAEEPIDSDDSLSVRVHACVCGIDCSRLPGDRAVSLDARDAIIVKSSVCEALDGTTVFGH